MARIAIARGDWNRAGEELQAAGDLLNESLSEGDPSDFASLIAACRLRFWICSGKTEAAKRLIQERELRLENDPDYSRESEYVALAWFSIVEAARSLHTAPLPQVVRLLDRMCGRAEASGRMGNFIEMLAIRSLAMYSMGDKVKAMISLERALALAEPEGYIRTFVDLGGMMANLLQYAASRGIASDYVATLLAAFERNASRSQKDETSNGRAYTPFTVAPLAESLSERQLEVLRLVAEGLSNQQIAERLILAVGTVKRHINNISGKLGAGNRIQAVARARELGLL